MKKSIMIFALAVLILALGGETQAGITYVDVVDSGASFGSTRSYDQDWGWTHTFSPPEFPDVTINWATLDIYAYDVDYDQIDLVEGDGILLGQLDGSADNTWNTTTFTFDALAIDELADGAMNMWLNISSVVPSYWATKVESSTLTVDYDMILPEPPDDPATQTIPAPGAVLLGSIGISLVGWLRKRGTL